MRPWCHWSLQCYEAVQSMPLWMTGMVVPRATLVLTKHHFRELSSHAQLSHSFSPIQSNFTRTPMCWIWAWQVVVCLGQVSVATVYLSPDLTRLSGQGWCTIVSVRARLVAPWPQTCASTPPLHHGTGQNRFGQTLLRRNQRLLNSAAQHVWIINVSQLSPLSTHIHTKSSWSAGSAPAIHQHFIALLQSMQTNNNNRPGEWTAH